MSLDPLSPIAPARIRALLLPVGRIKRSRFLTFVDLLQPFSTVRLGDVSPDPRPDRNMFSPLAFPSGILLYDLSTSFPPASHLSLSPFELFREPLLVIGIGDAAEYAWLNQSRADDSASNGEADSPAPQDQDALEVQSVIEDLKEQFPKAYFHSFMMFDSTSQTRHPLLPQETILVPPKAQLKTTTLKTFMCDLTSTLLAEMNTLAKSITALPTLPSPASQNGAADSTPSWPNPELTGAQFSRRNSQTPITNRPESPISSGQKDLHRMSMPVLPSATGLPMAGDDSRATSPVTQGARTPPTTFDDIAGVNAANSLQRTNSNSSKSGSGAKDQNERVSIHGFGSGGVGERARNKGRGRISIVIGTLYMCAGQWHEALNQLIDGAVKARTFSDHLWHAKALENIMVCLLLFAWSGMDFQIPSVCSPSAEKSGSTKSPQHTPSSSVADFTAPGGAKSIGHSAALESLNYTIPDLVNMILNIYTRAANFAGESLPPLAFSECVIRFSKLLAAMNLSAGFLDDDSLHHLVQNTPLRQKPRLSVPRISINPTRFDIATMVLRALPGPVETSGINPTDRVVVLAGVAAVLSSLGLQRKKAIVMKEFISSLIPGLVQARKVGAAEMGVHPAAGLAALNMASGGASGAGALNLGEGEVENGINEFLGLLGRTYGVPDSRGTLLDTNLFNSSETGTEGLSTSKACQVAVEEILRVSSLRAFGSLSLKLDILRMCINFCEALPDFNGVIHFTALLLRLAGPGTAPKPNSTDVFVSLPREEQTRLYANISRTVAASNKLGLQHVETDYWDDFLVRGLFILDEPVPLRLTQHRPAELKSTTTGKDGPFLHNPWLKKAQSNAKETILVANEEYRFVISLQNPYDFELEVDSLRIATEDVEFSAHEKHFILGPYRTQKFPFTGIPRSTGTLKIIGCYIKVTGCRERLFPIFPEPWKPEKEHKMKKQGLKACLGAPVSRPTSAVATLSRASTSAPKPETLTFNVIQDQPVVVVTHVSLPQSAVMVLEGEKKRFTITLKNTSSTTTVDFVHISFQDSATSALQAATSNRDLSGSELHELEVQLAHFPPLRWCRVDEAESIHINPGEETTFDIEVLGRTRLTEAMIQIDYANIGKRRSEVQDQFFTRQVSVPISITVNASVQLQRPDIVPLSDDFIWSNQQIQHSDNELPSSSSPKTSPILCNQSDAHFQAFLKHAQNQGHDEYCMLLLDLRNSWPNPLSISLQARPSTANDGDQEQSWSHAYSVNEVIQPGHVNRVVMILPKIYLKDPHAPIPSLNPANQRQFVVSASKVSPEIERATREAFWYRDELLKLVRGTWTEDGNGRHGEIELRSIRLSARMAEAIRLEDIKIETQLVSDYEAADNDETIQQLGRSKFQVPVDEFLTLKTKVYNRSAQPISPVLRLLPHLAGLPHNIALDLDKRFSWTGVLQQKLPVVQPGESIVSDLGIVALCSGAFEVGATVEELELIKPDKNKKEGGRARSATETLMQPNLLAEAKLRVWHMKEPCIVVAKRM